MKRLFITVAVLFVAVCGFNSCDDKNTEPEAISYSVKVVYDNEKDYIYVDDEVEINITSEPAEGFSLDDVSYKFDDNEQAVIEVSRTDKGFKVKGLQKGSVEVSVFYKGELVKKITITVKEKEVEKTDDNEDDKNKEEETPGDKEDDKNKEEETPGDKEDTKPQFVFIIEDIFTISGRGTVVTGTLLEGTIKTMDDVEIIGFNDKSLKSVVTGIQISNKVVASIVEGNKADLLLRGIDKSQLKTGMAIVPVNTMKAAKKFKAKVYALSNDEGGRKSPFQNNYQPSFYLNNADVKCTVSLPSDVELFMPGTTQENISVELTSPLLLRVGDKAEFRESGKKVCDVTITEVIYE